MTTAGVLYQSVWKLAWRPRGGLPYEMATAYFRIHESSSSETC